ncbi:ead/Ea22-like family protein [Klebsiella quasipneumoniae]|uniref:ead/Ea22-like family protein n=1 Tax=Klebsiella quasipneumoniae TaxID=1463165 RepID=UPI003005DB2B
MTDITELAQRMKAAAEKATPGPWYVHDKPCEDGNYGIDTSDKEFLAEAVVWWGFARQSIWREEDAKYIALANPANILALVEALEKAQTINAAAEKLVRCKGRYHSEQNYRALAALFGVNTPDLQPLDGESRTVTVKPDDADEVREEGNQFLVVRHPGKVPVIKHPVGQLEDYLLQILKADPLATIDIVTHRYYGVGGQFVEDADEYLHEMGIKWEAE